MSVSCPHCLSPSTCRNGTGLDGRQNWFCKDCATTFRSNYSQRARQPLIQDQIIRYHQRGFTIRHIAKKLRIGKNTVHRHLSHWKTRVANWDIPHRCLYAEGKWQEGRQNPVPKLTVLNYSGGTGSTFLLEAVLRGNLEIPSPFRVLFADPGMEKQSTYQTVAHYERKCRERGIEFIRVSGGNLFRDLLTLPQKTRIDNPPYFTKKPNGAAGQLRQCCTYYYKIAPIDRAIRLILKDLYGINPKRGNLGKGIVEKWIGFSFDEIHRIKSPSQHYVRFRFPLIELGYDKPMIGSYFEEKRIPLPSRSLCNGCFAHSTEDLKTMHDHGVGIEFGQKPTLRIL